MYGMSPWGGFGATCLPQFNAKVIWMMSGFTDGGWPYSEGIYEDLSKFQWVQSYWNPKRATGDVLREYASYYLGRDSADDFVKLAHALEDTHMRGGWSIRKLDRAGEAWSLAQGIDSRLSGWSRKHWRWRLLFDRAAIDDIVSEHGARSLDAQKMLKPYCDEVTEVYHAQHTELRPPDLMEQVSPENVAYGKPVTASSTLPGYEGSEARLVDGFLAQHDAESFWVNDPSRGERSWVTIDLGTVTEIREIKLQFRNIEGKFWFIPSEVTFLTSQDGAAFAPLSITFVDADGTALGPFVTCSHLPKEDSPYISAFWRYRTAGAEGRYLRIDLGRSQHQATPYAGTVELTEVEVIRKDGGLRR